MLPFWITVVGQFPRALLCASSWTTGPMWSPFSCKASCFFWINRVLMVGVGGMGEASVLRALFPKSATEDANYCLQPIIICLLPIEYWSKVLITLALSSKLVRRKDALEFQEYHWLLFLLFWLSRFWRDFWDWRWQRKEIPLFFDFFLMPHMAVLLTRKPPTVNCMRLYNYRAKHSQLYSWEYLCLCPWSVPPPSRVRVKNKSCICLVLLTQGKHCCFSCWGCGAFQTKCKPWTN